MKTYLNYTFVLIVLFFTTFLTSVQAQKKNNGQFVVVLDAGHGGDDSGNIGKKGSGFREKDIALNIVLQVGKALEKHPNIKVIYTRKTDVFVTLRGRAKIANDADADLFVSVHCNAHHSEANGTETFVLGLHANQQNFEVAKKENEVIYLEDDYEMHYGSFDPKSPESLIGLTLMQEDYLDQSTLLAKKIQDNFTYKLKRKNRGVKQAGFWVLHNTAMPSVLIETGFLTYQNEGLYLNSSKGQSDMSTSIYQAIMDYIKALDNNVGSHVFEDIEPISTDTKVTTPVIEEVDLPKAEEVYEDVIFKVQIAASSKKLEPKPFNFSGLNGISRDKEGGIFKYFYGHTSDYTQAKALQDIAKKKGYRDCFIVAFKNGKRTDLTEVLKSAPN